MKMCSVSDSDYNEDKFMEKPPTPSTQTPCLKCGDENTSVLLRFKNWYCVQCFLSSVNHKFRSILGKNRLVRNNERVLIIYTGGYSSSVLLRIINEALKSSQHKKLMIQPIILYIDNGAILNHNKEHRIKISENILKDCSLYNFPVYISSISLSLYISSDQHLFSTLNNHRSFLLNVNDGPFINLLTNSTATTKIDVCNILRQKLILSIAQKMNCVYVFIPEISSDIACNTLIGFSLGKASHITLDVGFCDTRNKDITIIRPMRDFTIEEVILYCKHNNLQPVTIHEPSDNEDVYSSIQSVIKKFVNDLQVNFPATINTVVKISDKLTTKTDKCELSDLCRMCEAPLDTIEKERASARNAIAFSRIASSKCSQMVATESYDWHHIQEEHLKPKFDTGQYLCHGCTVTLEEITTKEILNEYILKDTN